MAAEHEGRRAGRRGDLPAALPRAGAHARARADARRRLRSPVNGAATHCVVRARSSVRERTSRAARRRAEQGLARRAAARDAARGRLPAAPRHPRARRAGPGQRHRVLLPAPARHRDLRRLRPARRRHHRPRPAARQRRAAADEILPLGFGPRRSGSPLARGGPSDGRRLGGQARSPRRTRAARALPRRARRRGRAWSSSTARSRPRSGSASPTRSPTWSRPGTTLRQAGLRDHRRADPRSPRPCWSAATGAPEARRRGPAACAGCRACIMARRVRPRWTTTSRPSSSRRRSR